MSTSSLDQLELQLKELEASADPQAAGQKFSAPWPEEARFAADSPLEETGFEPSVPRQIRSRFESSPPPMTA